MLVRNHDERGLLCRATGDADRALAELEAARALAERRVHDSPPDQLSLRRRELARVLFALGDPHCARGEPTVGLSWYEAAREVQRTLRRESLEVAGDTDGLATTHETIGRVLRQAGRTDEADQQFESAVALRSILVAMDPRSADDAGPLGDDLAAPAAADLDRGRFGATRDRLDESSAWLRRALEAEPGVPPRRRARLAAVLARPIALLDGLGLDAAGLRARRELDAPGTAPRARIALNPAPRRLSASGPAG